MKLVRSFVDVSHSSDLHSLLHIISLIDAYPIQPQSERSKFRSCQDLGPPIFLVEKAENFFRSYRDDEKDPCKYNSHQQQLKRKTLLPIEHLWAYE